MHELIVGIFTLAVWCFIGSGVLIGLVGFSRYKAETTIIDDILWPLAAYKEITSWEDEE